MADMSDAFSKLKSSFDKGITAISVKTASSLEKAKLKTQIDTTSSELTRLYAVVGEAAYNLWTVDNYDISSLEAQMTLISERKKLIGKLREELNGIDERDKKILGGSEVEVPQAMPRTETAKEYPPAEDYPDDTQELAKRSAAVRCPNCGESYNETVKFCRKCGQKLS